MEYYWDGARWRYGLNEPGPDGLSFHTVSSAVVSHGDYDYITVVGRTEDGHIWEYYWDLRVNSNWEWRKLYP